MIKIVVMLLVIFFISFGYMRTSCSGIYQKQVSKVPMKSSFGKEPTYEKCTYVGFKNKLNKQ